MTDELPTYVTVLKPEDIPAYIEKLEEMVAQGKDDRYWCEKYGKQWYGVGDKKKGNVHPEQD